jgi:hypothetical protein
LLFGISVWKDVEGGWLGYGDVELKEVVSRDTVIYVNISYQQQLSMFEAFIQSWWLSLEIAVS